MRRKRQTSFCLWILVLMVVCGCFVVSGKKASAASASISINSRTNKYYTGDTLYVVITVQSSTPIKSFQGTFSYDNSVLRYMTGGSIASGNDSEFYISDTNRETAVTSMKYSIKFYARKAKGTTIALKQPYIVAGEDGSEMSVSFNSLNLMVEKERDETAASKKPENGNTAKPKATPSKASKSPKPSKKPSPSKSPTPKPEVSPTKKAGDNKNSSSGKSGTATQNKAGITTSRSGDSVTLYAGAKYIVEEVEDDTEIPEGFGKTQCELDDELITAYALESDTEHSYFLIYCKKKKTDEKAEFYLYDQNEQTVMPYEKVQSWYRGIGEKSVVGERRDVADRTEETLKYIIAVMVVFCVLMLIAVISVYLHFKGSKDEWNI